MVHQRMGLGQPISVTRFNQGRRCSRDRARVCRLLSSRCSIIARIHTRRSKSHEAELSFKFDEAQPKFTPVWDAIAECFCGYPELFVERVGDSDRAFYVQAQYDRTPDAVEPITVRPRSHRSRHCRSSSHCRATKSKTSQTMRTNRTSAANGSPFKHWNLAITDTIFRKERNMRTTNKLEELKVGTRLRLRIQNCPTLS